MRDSSVGSPTVEELTARARSIRLNIVRMVGIGQKGHLGGSCSIADVVAALYFSKMRHDPRDPAEEHTVIGGLGSLIAEVFRGAGLPMKCLGIEDRFGQSAHSYGELLEAYGLTSDNIQRAALSVAGRRQAGNP